MAALKRPKGMHGPFFFKDSELQKFIVKAEQALGVKTVEYLGCGGNGCVLRLADSPLVMKISASQSEHDVVRAVARIRAYEGFARIGQIANVSSRNIFAFAYTREALIPIQHGTDIFSPRDASLLGAAHDAADSTSEEEYREALSRFPDLLAGVASTMLQLFEEEQMFLMDVNTYNLGWRNHPAFGGSGRAELVMFDAEAVR